MATTLAGKRIAFLVATEGFEQVEVDRTMEGRRGGGWNTANWCPPKLARFRGSTI